MNKYALFDVLFTLPDFSCTLGNSSLRTKLKVKSATHLNYLLHECLWDYL